MNSKKIKLSGINDALTFVRAAENCEFEVDVHYNHFIIDGKSIIGVCSLDLNKELTVNYNGFDGKFEQVLSSFHG